MPGKTTSRSLPSQSLAAMGCRGSNQTSLPAANDVEHKIRSSPVYAGHAIKPLKTRSSRGRLQSWTGSGYRPRPNALLLFRWRRRVSFLSSILAGMRKGMISYHLRFSECEHGPASKCQHARKALCSRSCPACQEQNSDQFTDPPRPSENFSDATSHDGGVARLGAGGSHETMDCRNSRPLQPRQWAGDAVSRFRLMVAGSRRRRYRPLQPPFGSGRRHRLHCSRARSRRASLAAGLVARGGRGRRVPGGPWPAASCDDRRRP